jgi:hypothetical protein
MKVDAAGRAKRQAVQIGIVSSSKAVVVSRLDAGEPVIPANNAKIKAGQRVRASAATRPER